MHEAIKPQSSDYMEDQVQICCVPTLSISQKLKKKLKNWRDIMGKDVLHLEKYLTEVLLECPKLELNMATWDDHMSSDSIGEGADQNDCP